MEFFFGFPSEYKIVIRRYSTLYCSFGKSRQISLEPLRVTCSSFRKPRRNTKRFVYYALNRIVILHTQQVGPWKFSESGLPSPVIYFRPALLKIPERLLITMPRYQVSFFLNRSPNGVIFLSRRAEMCNKPRNTPLPERQRSRC